MGFEHESGVAHDKMTRLAGSSPLGPEFSDVVSVAEY